MKNEKAPLYQALQKIKEGSIYVTRKQIKVSKREKQKEKQEKLF